MNCNHIKAINYFLNACNVNWHCNSSISSSRAISWFSEIKLLHGEWRHCWQPMKTIPIQSSSWIETMHIFACGMQMSSENLLNVISSFHIDISLSFLSVRNDLHCILPSASCLFDVCMLFSHFEQISANKQQNRTDFCEEYSHLQISGLSLWHIEGDSP